MKVKSLNIENIRCHKYSSFEFNSNFNIFFGENGIGKTSILEAISYCSLGKSFTNSSDNTILNDLENKFNINLSTINDSSFEYFVKVNYELNKKKTISNSYSDVCTTKDLISNFPLVILNPDLKDITFGGPINRRNFIDKIISYCNISFYQTLTDYKKILKQRNHLLSLGQKDRYFDYSQLEVWDNKLIEMAVKITLDRLIFLYNFKPIFLKYYQEVSNDRENVNIIYKYNNDFINESDLIEELINNNDKKELQSILTQKLNEISEKLKKIERIKGITSFGPHKDDLNFIINNRIVKDSASQGQHKTFLIALKFAELDYVEKYRREKPVVLLDDIFSELDEVRSKKLIEVLSRNKSQVFITLTETNKLSFLQELELDTTIYNMNENNLNENNLNENNLNENNTINQI